MEFRLYYRGGLRANGPAEEKQNLRRHFHKRLKSLWHQPSSAGYKVQLIGDEAALVIERAQRTAGHKGPHSHGATRWSLRLAPPPGPAGAPPAR